MLMSDIDWDGCRGSCGYTRSCYFLRQWYLSDDIRVLCGQLRCISHLHCTSMFAVSDALPQWLLTSHLYSPASALLMFVNTRALSWERIWPPALIQDTIGKGIPDALHGRVTLPPSDIAWLCIGCVAGGAVSKQVIVDGEDNYYQSMHFVLVFIDRRPATRPSNKYLQMMVCSRVAILSLSYC